MYTNDSDESDSTFKNMLHKHGVGIGRKIETSPRKSSPIIVNHFVEGV